MQKSIQRLFGILLLLGWQQLQAQNLPVSNFVGEYACISHGVSGLSIETSAQGYKMIFCKDLIMNTCEEFSLHKTIGNSHDLLAEGSDFGIPLRGMTAVFTQEGTEPILAITLADGLVISFVKR